MSQNRSKKSSRLGSRVEKAVCEEYGLQPTHTSWYDAVYANGTPVEIKAAIHRRSSGRPGKFRVFKDPHEKLVENDGYYVFAVYRRRGSGAEVLKSVRVDAEDVTPSWRLSGHKDRPGNKESQIRLEDVFG